MSNYEIKKKFEEEASIKRRDLYTIDEVVKAVNTWAISPVDKHNIEIFLNRS